MKDDGRWAFVRVSMGGLDVLGAGIRIHDDWCFHAYLFLPIPFGKDNISSQNYKYLVKDLKPPTSMLLGGFAHFGPIIHFQ